MEKRGRKKGSIPWNKGKKGWTSSGSFKKGRVPSKEELEKLSLIRRKIKRSDEFKKNLSNYNKKIGRKVPIKKREEHYNWKGGITSENQILRHSVEYRLWRDSVFKRDNFTCIWCGLRGVSLEADHIQLWSEVPELRFAIDNGRTLCRSCHLKRHTKNASHEGKIPSF